MFARRSVLSPELIRHLLPKRNAANLKRRRCASCSSPEGLLGYLKSEDNGIDIQDQWCCSPSCFERVTERTLQSLIVAKNATERRREHRMPLGLILLSHGVISREQLRVALETQQEAGHGRIGEWLQQLGYATEDQVLRGLGVQWGFPVLKNVSGLGPIDQIVPFQIMLDYGIVPIHHSSGTKRLYLGVSQSVSHSLLYAIDQMLGCKTEPYIVSDSILRRELDQARASARESVFRTIRNVQEIARISTSYAMEVQASEMRVTRCDEHIWTRLRSRLGTTDLVFVFRDLAKTQTTELLQP